MYHTISVNNTKYSKPSAEKKINKVVENVSIPSEEMLFFVYPKLTENSTEIKVCCFSKIYGNNWHLIINIIDKILAS